MAKQKSRRTSTIVMTNTVAPRNPYADHPMMRKGGVHEKSKSALRAETRRETKRLARDWSFTVNLSLVC